MLAPKILLGLLCLALSLSPPVVAASQPGLTPAPAETQPQDVIIRRDLAYGDHARQRLDVYQPSHSATTPAPLIFMVHGGAWRTGDKTAAAVVKAKVGRWLPRGFVFVAVNYRLLPEANPRQQAEDVARALAYVQTHAADWAADGNNILLMGHSAGAHLVSLLASDRRLQQAHALRPWAGSIVLDSAALDVVSLMKKRHLRLYDEAFGADPAFWPQLSPLQQLQAETPPFLLVCSQTRRDDSCAQALRFAKAVARAGGQAHVQAEALSHADINAMLGQDNAYTREIEHFMSGLGAAFADRLPAP